MADLIVSKKSIKELFSELKNRKFIIPDYQRPYKWDIDKCRTLWEDLEHFFLTEAKDHSDYFLGTIVSYTNSDKNPEIIDGQQRITSFMLLLRAFYKKLEMMNEDSNVLGLKNQIAPCLWEVSRISQQVEDKTKIHIHSEVATEEDNETFHRILQLGEVDKSNRDNYSVNYTFFLEQCNKYAENNPLHWNDFCITILEQCVVLPIECDTQDTALTIFSTLNDRGMPLADSDIFKAQLYRSYEGEAKKDFTDKWKELTKICEEGNFTIDDIFKYYTHVLRAEKNDKSREIGLRKFYAEDKYKKLRRPNLLEDIIELAVFWKYLNAKYMGTNKAIDPYPYIISEDTRKYIQCLNYYPNEFWKFPVSVFFIKNRTTPNFDEKFNSILKELVAFLFVKFIYAPTVNAIRDDIFDSCIALNAENKLKYSIDFNKDFLKERLANIGSSTRMTRALLLLYAYLDKGQTSLIDSFDIEHIFPKKWQNTNYNGWERGDAELYLDKLGNKTVFEKRLNIQAGNQYFAQKKIKYAESMIATVQALSKYPKPDWVKEDIEKREEKVIDTLLSFFENHLSKQ